MRWGPPEDEGRYDVRRRVIIIAAFVAVVASMVLSGLYLAHDPPFSRGGGSDPSSLAPDFTLTTFYGHNFTLSSYR